MAQAKKQSKRETRSGYKLGVEVDAKIRPITKGHGGGIDVTVTPVIEREKKERRDRNGFKRERRSRSFDLEIRPPDGLPLSEGTRVAGVRWGSGVMVLAETGFAGLASDEACRALCEICRQHPGVKLRGVVTRPVGGSAGTCTVRMSVDPEVPEEAKESPGFFDEPVPAVTRVPRALTVTEVGVQGGSDASR